jgi:hypothetical protein
MALRASWVACRSSHASTHPSKVPADASSLGRVSRNLCTRSAHCLSSFASASAEPCPPLGDSSCGSSHGRLGRPPVGVKPPLRLLPSPPRRGGDRDRDLERGRFGRSESNSWPLSRRRASTALRGSSHTTDGCSGGSSAASALLNLPRLPAAGSAAVVVELPTATTYGPSMTKSFGHAA